MCIYPTVSFQCIIFVVALHLFHSFLICNLIFSLMLKSRFFNQPLFFFLSVLLTINIGCSSDDNDSTQSLEATVHSKVLAEDGNGIYGYFLGKFSGNGGSAEKIFSWENSLNTAYYNAIITSPGNGLFTMVVKDADGNIVLNKSLPGDNESDSFSGVTVSGTPGIWSVTFKLSSFDGDGSFSLSEKNRFNIN